jgi:molybdenum cofactor cytidylyltransferase
VNAEHVARVLADARGGLKNKPAAARVIPLINKVEGAQELLSAHDIARALLQNNAIDAVAIGAVRTEASPVQELVARVSAIILAAGGSTRMRGASKQLLPWGDTTFVGNAVRVASRARVTDVVVVTGSGAEQVVPHVRDLPGVRVVHNPDWATGRASSVRAGLGALPANVGGALFVNADQPFLSDQVLDTILERYFQTHAPIVVPTYAGKTGSPVLFARELFAGLRALQGEQGGRDLLETYRDAVEKVEISDLRAAIDLDTPEEYARAQSVGGYGLRGGQGNESKEGVE